MNESAPLPLRTLPPVHQDAEQYEESECKDKTKCEPQSRTVEVLKMMMDQHTNVQPADLFVHVGDMSYADGDQV